MFVLQHLIESKKSRKAFYCCFVDFRNAFDRVRRDYLIRGRLAELGVHGRMLHAIIQMYWSVPLVPKLHGKMGDAIPSTCGVKQGVSSGIGLLGRKGNPGCNGRSGIAPYIITLCPPTRAGVLDGHCSRPAQSTSTYTLPCFRQISQIACHWWGSIPRPLGHLSLHAVRLNH